MEVCKKTNPMGSVAMFYGYSLWFVVLIVFLGFTTSLKAQIKAEQYLISPAGNEGNYPTGGNISWTIGEVVVFSGVTNGFPILGGMQSYPICYQTSNLTIVGSAGNLCGTVPLTLSVPGAFASYQWYLNSGKIVGATSGTYTPVTDGTYSVFVKLLGGLCSFTSSGYSVSLASGVVAPTISSPGAPKDTLLVSSSASSYEWYVDNRRIIGEIAQNYRVLFNGSYQVKVRYPGGCMLISNSYPVNMNGYDDITKSGAVITDSTIYFPKEKGFSGIQIHPNPTPDFVTVEYYSSSNTIPVLQVFSGEGKMILEDKNPIVSLGYKKFEVDLRLFARAMYFIKLTEGDEIKIEKVIKY